VDNIGRASERRGRCATVRFKMFGPRVGTVAAGLACAAVTACGGAAPRVRTGAGSARGSAAAQATSSPRASIEARRRRAARASALAACSARPPAEHLITARRWLSGTIVTEYYPVPERWFSGRRVSTPGLPGRHRVDWLYSARGLSMEGDGVDLAGRPAHIADLGNSGWVSSSGRHTVPPRCGVGWSAGAPSWRDGGWRNAADAVTYPLAHGGWSDGPGHRVGGYGGATFASGHSLTLTPYRSVAVDPRLIPPGSRIYIPAYQPINGGWFVAQDTGGAIIGRHIDVYRPPTRKPFGSGRLLTSARVLVIPPGS